MMDRATIIEVLTEARDLIAAKNQWTVVAMARDRHGKEVPPEDPTACRWCGLGAIIAITARRGLRPLNFNINPACTALQDACAALPGRRCAETVNDFDGHPAMVALFNRAIAEVEDGWPYDV